MVSPRHVRRRFHAGMRLGRIELALRPLPRVFHKESVLGKRHKLRAFARGLAHAFLELDNIGSNVVTAIDLYTRDFHKKRTGCSFVLRKLKVTRIPARATPKIWHRRM